MTGAMLMCCAMVSLSRRMRRSSGASIAGSRTGCWPMPPNVSRDQEQN
nr:MAG TPA: hypothetical protein [Caudoviricetes sp.]